MLVKQKISLFIPHTGGLALKIAKMKQSHYFMEYIYKGVHHTAK